MATEKSGYRSPNIRIKGYGEDVLTASGDAIGDFDPNWLKDQEEQTDEN